MIRIVWPPRELSANGRAHFRVRARLVKQHKAWAFAATKAAGKIVLPDGLLDVAIRFVPPKNYPYDIDNLLARMKAPLDGIADALGVNDRRFRPRVELAEKDPLGVGYVMVEVGASRE